MSKESVTLADKSVTLAGNLDQVEQVLTNTLNVLAEELKKSKGTHKLELEQALNIMNPFVEKFKKDKHSLTNSSYLESFKNYTMSKLELLNQKLGNPTHSIKNSVVLNAVKDVLENVYDFLKTSISAMLDNSIKAGEFAKSIVDLGTTMISNKKPAPTKTQNAELVLPDSKKEVPTLLGNLDIIEKGFNEAQKSLSEAIKNADQEQKPKLQNALSSFEPIVESFVQTKKTISAEKLNFTKLLDDVAYSSTVLGSLQNWGKKQVETIMTTKPVKTVTNNPTLNAVVGVVKSGGDLLKSTITNTLARTIKTAKVVKSVVDLGVAIRNSVQKKSLGR